MASQFLSQANSSGICCVGLIAGYHGVHSFIFIYSEENEYCIYGNNHSAVGGNRS